RQSLDHLVRQRQRRLFGLWFERNHLENAAQRRTDLQEARDAGRGRLGPYHQPAGDDRRQDLVEDARALALMGAAAREREQIRDVPDNLLVGRELVDGLTDAPLELAEPLLASH